MSVGKGWRPNKTFRLPAISTPSVLGNGDMWVEANGGIIDLYYHSGGVTYLLASNMIRDYYVEVARGNVTGDSIVHVTGLNEDIDTASGFETIWTGSSTYTGQNPTGAELVEVFSGSGNDAAAGTGARTIRIEGLDANYEAQTEDITLNGATGVDSIGSYIRLTNLRVLTAGSTGSNEGVITARQKVTTANIFFEVGIGNNASQTCTYTVPAGKNAWIIDWVGGLSVKQTGLSVARLFSRPFGGVYELKSSVLLSSEGSSFFQRRFTGPKDGLAEKTDIKVMADSSVNNMGVWSALDFLLVDDA